MRYRLLSSTFTFIFVTKALTEFFENVIGISTKKFTGKDAVVYSGWIDLKEN